MGFPLDPREAFYGGRTVMVKCYHTAKVDAFFYPKTEAQQQDQQVFFNETLQSQLKF